VIWDPSKMEQYAPAWREYCEKKGWPGEWGNPNATTSDSSGGEQNGGRAEDRTCGDEIDEEEEVVAWCIGHQINSKGHVHMVLKWSDDPEDSLARVSKVMGVENERKAYGKTWLSYCDGKGFHDELFRTMGNAQVVNVLGHEWDDDGRPMAEVEWKHGEVDKIVVAAALEKNSDHNKMRACWAEYCGRIGNMDAGFGHGHVDKSKRKKPITQGKTNKKKHHY
jgi:hypothetical protein